MYVQIEWILTRISNIDRGTERTRNNEVITTTDREIYRGKKRRKKRSLRRARYPAIAYRRAYNIILTTKQEITRGRRIRIVNANAGFENFPRETKPGVSSSTSLRTRTSINMKGEEEKEETNEEN
jgi:hypothetical protein